MYTSHTSVKSSLKLFCTRVLAESYAPYFWCPTVQVDAIECYHGGSLWLCILVSDYNHTNCRHAGRRGTLEAKAPPPPPHPSKKGFFRVMLHVHSQALAKIVEIQQVNIHLQEGGTVPAPLPFPPIQCENTNSSHAVKVVSKLPWIHSTTSMYKHCVHKHCFLQQHSLSNSIKDYSVLAITQTTVKKPHDFFQGQLGDFKSHCSFSYHPLHTGKTKTLHLSVIRSICTAHPLDRLSSLSQTRIEDEANNQFSLT